MDYSVVFSSNKIFHEKSSWIRSWFKQFCKCFFLRPSLSYLDVQKSSQCVLPMPSLRILRYVFKSWDFMKLIISTASCKVKQTFVKLWVENIVTTSVCCYCAICVKVPVVLWPLLFCYCAKGSIVKKATDILVLLGEQLWPHGPCFENS